MRSSREIENFLLAFLVLLAYSAGELKNPRHSAGGVS